MNPIDMQGEKGLRRSEFPEIHAMQNLKDSSVPIALVWDQYPVMDKDSS